MNSKDKQHTYIDTILLAAVVERTPCRDMDYKKKNCTPTTAVSKTHFLLSLFCSRFVYIQISLCRPGK
jgi:hypothetical protein